MDTGIPARLTEELDFDGDLLGALAALELCAQLAVSTPGGLTFLDHLGIIERLAQGLEGAEALVVSNLVKFFGQIGTAMDKIAGVEQLFRAYSILERVQNLMDSPTGTLETSLFVFVENLGSTTRGLSLLKEQGQLVSSVLSDYRSASTEGRLVALHAISVLIEHCPPELASFAQQIYDDLGRTPLKDLVHLCRSAVEENRIAGYSVIKALTKHAWGLRALLSSPDVVGNWLFDRRTDTSRAGLEWKFSVVQGILVSPANAEGIVGPEMKARLQRYVNEGPFYMPTEAAVAFMSS